MPQDPPKPETLAAQALHRIDPATGSVAPPIYPAATYARDEAYRPIGPVYSRDGNPTYLQAEALLAKLEGGADGLLLASGMAAATAVFQALRPGDHIAVQSQTYWVLRSWVADFAERWGVPVTWFDGADPDSLARAVKPGTTKLVWIETPANPCWEVVDIAAAARTAHAVGARLAVDSTVATPVHTRPIDLGADIVMHAATKALNGHGDIVAGALVCAEADEFWERVRYNRLSGGGVLGAFEAWLLLRGLRTLFVRLPRMAATALAIAEALKDHPAVAAVLYPGLPNHPGHDIAARQMAGGYGYMLSLRMAGGFDTAARVCSRVKLFTRATSLGETESLIEHRKVVEGETSPCPPDLLRLSIGLEDAGDLIADLRQAIDG